jgi:hypothetical protein
MIAYDCAHRYVTNLHMSMSEPGQCRSQRVLRTGCK